MNVEFFIAKRLFSDKENKSTFTGPIISIAIVGIALGIAVMIISIAVVTGFKNEIRNKIIGFGSHIQITNFDNNSTYETIPIPADQHFYPSINEFKGIEHIQTYATKPGILKTNNDIQGVVLKGVGSEYNWDFFKNSLTEGHVFKIQDSAKTNKALISKYLATLLKLKVGDNFKMFFAQDPPRMRKFIIEGIYETSLIEFDKIFIMVDIKHVQKLNNWSKNLISGFEITIDNFTTLDEMTNLVFEVVGYNFQNDRPTLKISNIKEKNVQIFDWLNLQDMNVYIILVLILIVAGINMVSGLLILILERTKMIGILKSLGTTNLSIRKIFIYQSWFLILKGMLWGNLIGLAVCFIQNYFKILKLDQTSYFLNTVPININLLHLIFLNIGTILVIVLFLLIPSMIIAKISPVKTIRFE